MLAAPPGPLGTFAPQVLRPGSAVAVGYSNGDVRTSSVGTVAYVDGDRVWVFGHELEGNGRRALLLQDAYIYRVINNPLGLGQLASTYKLGASGHDLGTISNDGFSAVAGRLGALPHTVPVNVLARDEDRDVQRAVNTKVADEAAVDLPSGGSWTSFVAPLAVAQAAGAALGSTPGRLTGEMCARISLAELDEPLRFCNRYISLAATESEDGTMTNAVLSGAASDLGGALATIDAYTGKPPRVTGVSALLKVRRGADLASIRSISLPRRVRPGQRVRARVGLQRLRGDRLTRTYPLRIPSDLRRGTQRLRFVGQDADEGEDAFHDHPHRAKRRTTTAVSRVPRRSTNSPSRSARRALRRRDAARRRLPRAGVSRRRPPDLRPGRGDGARRAAAEPGRRADAVRGRPKR